MKFDSEREERKDDKEEFYVRKERHEYMKMKMKGRRAKDSPFSQDWKDGQRKGW